LKLSPKAKNCDQHTTQVTVNYEAVQTFLEVIYRQLKQNSSVIICNILKNLQVLGAFILRFLSHG